ncbi:MAG: decarboxylating 6-phosphogluconate dehydrogenase [Candidatus Daviesbacteria bacterium]|nr:decarboxylating 6-phosphogluconate dehydrogenase [Candidatus Daviesbacteria bacterium]
MKIGYIGLGRMGKNMVFHLLEQGIEIVAWNRSPDPVAEVAKAGATPANSIDDLISKLETPRIIWVMVTAGEVVDEIVNQLAEKLSPGDLVIDGGNSFYKDTLKRNEILAKKGIHFMDIGTSGGPGGARSGACLMIGGEKEDYEKITELAKAAASPDAYQYLGPIGAGHFAKMVHNAIEYGMMESIGEGLSILKFSPFKYDFNKVLDIYMHRSVVESRLVNWAWDAFKEDPELSDISSSIGSGGSGKRVPGEADWTVDVAREMGIDVPAMESAIKIRENSDKDPEDSPEGFRNKVISAMRGQFGQHAVKKTK